MLRLYPRKKQPGRAGSAERTGRDFVQSLEKRVLLAATSDVFSVSNLPPVGATNSITSDLKNGPFSNAGSTILNLVHNYAKYSGAGGTPQKYQNQYTAPLYVQAGTVLVTVRTRQGTLGLNNTIRSLGGALLSSDSKYGVAEAFMPILKLRDLATNPSIVSISAVSRMATHQAGSADNKADQSEIADRLRSAFNLDGTGVTVGVLSDSVGRVGNGVADSVASGDLPASGVNVIEDGSDPIVNGRAQPTETDEGRAMLELIHDIAPGAKLAFATANLGQQHFADNIRALQAAGCKVIVDDVGYFEEPMFQPGVIDQAIADFTKAGGVYLSAAGNSSVDGYDAPANYTTIHGKQFIDFDPGPLVDTRMTIDITGSDHFVLEWDNPYNGVVGHATADLDVYFYDLNQTGHPLAASSTDNNLRTSQPIEFMPVLAAGHYEIEIRVNQLVPGAVLPTRFKFVAAGGLGSTEYSDGLRASTYGHNAGPNTISVGAVFYADAPPFVSEGSGIANELFSSNGPVVQVFDLNGNRLANPLTLQKPDISGADGANTSFFTGPRVPPGVVIFPTPGNGDITDQPSDPDIFPNFFGTSAAAPNVAAVVALMLQADPVADWQEIANAFKATARPLNGSGQGTFDPQGGFGLINAYDAIQQLADTPQAFIVNPAPSGSFGSINRIKVYFSQQVNGFDVSDIVLSRDGGSNLLTGNNSPRTVDSGRVWWVGNLADVTATPGHYVMTVQSTDTEITNVLGLPLSNVAIAEFDIFPVPTTPTAPANFRQDFSAFAPNFVRLRWTDTTTQEATQQIQRALDPNFTLGVTTFSVGKNVTVFDDTTLGSTGGNFYYRIRAVNGLGEPSGFSNTVKVTALAPSEVVLDNSATGKVTLTGAWTLATVGSGFLGDNYLDDGNTGKGSKSVKFTPTIATSGTYRVYFRWVQGSDRATNVPVDINFGSGSTTIMVDERNTGGSGWVQLGTFGLSKGTIASVTVRTTGTNGRVTADAVWFQPISQ